MLTKIWTLFLLSFAGGTILAWLVARVHEGGVHPVRGLGAFFGRQPKAGRVLLGTFFIALWVIAGTKPDVGTESHPYTSLQTRVGESDGTNGVRMAAGLDGGYRSPSSPEAATDALHAESQNGLHSVADGDAAGTETADDGRTDATPVVSTNAARTLAEEDLARGFVMHRIGMSEAFDFAAPPGATVCADWEAFGAAEDWFYLPFTNRAFRIGASEASRFRVFSFGQVDLYANHPYTSLQTRVGTGSDSPAASTGRDVPVAPRLWPFRATLGIVPRANWPRITGNGNATADGELAPSRFWHFVTPSNTFLLTWQNRPFRTPRGRATFVPGGTVAGGTVHVPLRPVAMRRGGTPRPAEGQFRARRGRRARRYAHERSRGCVARRTSSRARTRPRSTIRTPAHTRCRSAPTRQRSPAARESTLPLRQISPIIVPEDLFYRVQQRMVKNAHAPAHTKAKESEFLLTTKLFCGKCERMMVGESCNSHTGAMHYYYKCGDAKRKKGCGKKAVKKDWIERAVVRLTME